MRSAAPVTRAEAEQLVLVYNRLTQACPGVPRDERGQPVGRKVTAKSVREATAFLRFCAEKAIDPERFIVARLDAMGRRGRLALKDLHRVGDNFLDHFATWGDARAHDVTRAVQPVESYDALTAFSEALKATYAHAPDVCMMLPDARGWHPASTWCQRCPKSEACRRRLSPAARAKRETVHVGE